jgi:hypothetical protein
VCNLYDYVPSVKAGSDKIKTEVSWSAMFIDVNSRYQMLVSQSIVIEW